MANREIIDYIKKGLKQGFPLTELKQSLLAKGYADFDVDEAIKEYNSNSGGGKNLDSPGKSLSFFSPKFVLYSIFGILAAFVVVFLAIWTGQSDGATIYLNEGLDQGLSVDLMQNKVELDVGGENETIEFSSSKTSVNLDYGSGEESLIVGEKKNIDLDDDGVYDLEIRLDAIVEGVPKIYFKKVQLKVGEEKVFTSEVEIVKEIPEIYEVETELETLPEEKENESEEKEENKTGVCVEEWICTEWSSCDSNGVQERRCVDVNICGRNNAPEKERTCYYQEPVDPLPPEEDVEEEIKEFVVESFDPLSGVVYSKINLTLNLSSIETSNLRVMSLYPFGFEASIGGTYSFADEILSFNEQDFVLEDGAKIEITYTQDAIDMYKRLHTTFVESDLTLAYYDPSQLRYFPLESVYDQEKRIVKAEVDRLYAGGFSIIQNTDLLHICGEEGLAQDFQDCYTEGIIERAVAEGNEEICFELEDENARSGQLIPHCYAKVALETGDESICGEIPDKVGRTILSYSEESCLEDFNNP